MDDLERELRVWLKAGMPDYPSLAAIVRVKFAEKDAELANRHAEVERLRGFVAELRRDSLHTDLVATLAEKNAELARLTAEVERAMAEAREAIRMADEDGGSSMTTPTPDTLIAPLWRSDDATITLSMKDWQRVLLHYGTSLHMRNGLGCELAGKRIGPGVYEVRLKEKVYG